jgi:hypothetical protein
MLFTPNRVIGEKVSLASRYMILQLDAMEKQRIAFVAACSRRQSERV